MKWNLATSLAIHFMILFMAFVALPNPETFTPIQDTPITVELVSIEDITPKPDPPEPPPQPEPQPVFEPPPPEPEPIPEPEPVPLPPEPEPEPEPVPLPPEPEPEPEPEPDPPKPPQEDVEDVPPPPPPPPPPIKPVREIEKQRDDKKESLDTIAALLNKIPDEPKPPQNDAPKNPIEALQDDIDTQLIIQLLGKRIRDRVRRCWSPPVGLQDAGLLVVTLRVKLNADGTLNGAPIHVRSNLVPSQSLTIAREAAIRAVIRCQPYENLPSNLYEKWKNIVINFDPKQMAN